MTTYMTFKQAQLSLAPTSRVSAVSTGSSGQNRGGKCVDPDASKKALPPQSEVEKCTHIEARYYPPAEYKKFTPAEKQLQKKICFI